MARFARTILAFAFLGAALPTAAEASGLTRFGTVFLSADMAATMFAEADVCGWPTADAERAFEREAAHAMGQSGPLADVRRRISSLRQQAAQALREGRSWRPSCAPAREREWRRSVYDIVARIVEGD